MRHSLCPRHFWNLAYFLRHLEQNFEILAGHSLILVTFVTVQESEVDDSRQRIQDVAELPKRLQGGQFHGWTQKSWSKVAKNISEMPQPYWTGNMCLVAKQSCFVLVQQVLWTEYHLLYLVRARIQSLKFAKEQYRCYVTD